MLFKKSLHRRAVLIIPCAILSISFFLVSTALARTNQDLLAKKPLAFHNAADITIGRVGPTLAKRLEALKLELATPDNELIEKMVQKYGDFGIPVQLPDDNHLLEYLLYSADHIRTPYLHMGKDLKNNLAFLWRGEALRDLWVFFGREDARRKYEIILNYALRHVEAMTDEELFRKIDDRGSLNLWHPLLKSAALYYSRLYSATGDDHHARRTVLILERFGEVVGKWKVNYLHGINGKERATFTFDSPVPTTMNYGLWGYWGNVHDLNSALPLLESYILIKDSRAFQEHSENEKKKITDDLLCGLVERSLLFKFQPLHNQNMGRIKGMAYFGKLLNQPQYVHTAIRWMDDVLNIGFRSDGMWCEGTVAYGFPVAQGLFDAAEILRGYTDPPGYIDSVDGMRLDRFNPDKTFAADLERIKKAFDLLALPDGRSVAFEDSTWDHKGFYFSEPPAVAKPFLLAPSGIGMMGFGEGNNQVRLYLHWDGTDNHDHYDSLGFSLWARGKEVASETAYRGLHDWNISTAAHNTVLVDGKNQDGRAHKFKKKDDTLPLYPKYKHGELWGKEALFDDAGSIQLWDATSADVQVAEIDGTKAYDKSTGTSLYRRTLVLIKAEDERFYVIDIFRVSGGNAFEYMLHGDLSERYKVRISGKSIEALPPIPQKIKMGKYLECRKGIESYSGNFVAEFVTEKGPYLRTTFLGKPGTSILVAEGPAIRLGKEPSAWKKPGEPSPVSLKSRETSEFLTVKRSGTDTIFVAVHEVCENGKEPLVKDLELINIDTMDPMAVGIRVRLEDRDDILYSTMSSDSELEDKSNGLLFVGKMMFGVIRNGQPVKAVAFGASRLSWGNFILKNHSACKGMLHHVESKSAGYSDNAVFLNVLPPECNAVPGSVIMIYDGRNRPHAFTINATERLPDGKIKITVNEEIGLASDDDGLTLLFYPCWRIPSKPTYSIGGRILFSIMDKLEGSRK